MMFVKHLCLLLFICELRSFLNEGGTRTLDETKEMAHQYIKFGNRC